MSNSRVKCLFSMYLKENFNCFLIDKLFKNQDDQIIVGYQDGMIKTYNLPNFTAQNKKIITIQNNCYESKGSAIQSLRINRITKFSGNDLVVSDSRGQVTLFCDQQILIRKSISQFGIQHLFLNEESNGLISILVCDDDGCLTCFTPYKKLWKINLTDRKSIKSIGIKPSITCIQPVCLNTINNVNVHYVLAADDIGNLIFLNDDTVVLILKSTFNITSICQGVFMEVDNIGTQPNKSSNLLNQMQVALGSSSGSIYLLDNFEIFKEEFASVKFPVKTLHKLSLNNSLSTKTTILDLLVVSCSGNSYNVLKDGKIFINQNTDSWITHIFTKDIDNDGDDEIVFSLKDNSIHAHKILTN